MSYLSIVFKVLYKSFMSVHIQYIWWFSSKIQYYWCRTMERQPFQSFESNPRRPGNHQIPNKQIISNQPRRLAIPTRSIEDICPILWALLNGTRQCTLHRLIQCQLDPTMHVAQSDTVSAGTRQCTLHRLIQCQLAPDNARCTGWYSVSWTRQCTLHWLIQCQLAPDNARSTCWYSVSKYYSDS